jgi:fatty acid amide hydrolase
MMKSLFYWVLDHTLFSGLFWKLLLLYWAVKIGIVFAKRFLIQRSFTSLVEKRKKECDQSFQYDIKIDDISPKLQEEILQSDIVALRELIWTGKVTSEQVLKFYFSRARTVGRELGAAVEANFEQALKLAKAADAKIKTTDRIQLPPLTGIPFSVKENFLMEGMKITHGLEPRLGSDECICKETCPLIQHLISQGAIPFVRSNVPQLLMAAETDNPVYGACLNPHNKNRVCGGSSGGEGSLVGSGCSPWGIGNDIGGSVRIPSLMCGVFGFKPSTGRMDDSGQLSPIHVSFNKYLYQDYIKVVNGPIAKSVSDLKIITKIMFDEKINRARLSSLPPLEWREKAAQVPEGKLTIGYIDSIDELLETSKSNKRAVHEVVEALRKAGHTLIPVQVPKIDEMFKLAVSMFLSDSSMQDNIALSSGIKLIPAYRNLLICLLLPTFIKKGLAFILNKIGKPRFATLILTSCVIPTNKMFQLANYQHDLTRDFLESLLQKDIKYLISPGMGLPAPRHKTTGELLPNFMYTILFNFLGLPTGALPVTRVRPDEQTYSSRHADPVTAAAVDCMKDSEGLPIGVQVSALPFRDEECLGLMQHIEALLHLQPLLKI